MFKVIDMFPRNNADSNADKRGNFSVNQLNNQRKSASIQIRNSETQFKIFLDRMESP